MNSNDLIIRTERSIFEVVLNNESEIIALKSEVKALSKKVDEQYIVLTSNQQILAGKVDNLKESLGLMQTIFTWGFAAVAISVAIAPIVKSWIESRQNLPH